MSIDIEDILDPGGKEREGIAACDRQAAMIDELIEKALDEDPRIMELAEIASEGDELDETRERMGQFGDEMVAALPPITDRQLRDATDETIALAKIQADRPTLESSPADIADHGAELRMEAEEAEGLRSDQAAEDAIFGKLREAGS